MGSKRLIIVAGVASLLIMLALLTPGWAIASEGNNVEKPQELNQRQQAIIPIAAFTADGDIARLKPALNQGLDNGLSVNGIKEVIIQLYAYAGFPRSLNAMGAFMEQYNTERTNQGRYCQGRTPFQTFMEGLNLYQKHVYEGLDTEEAA